MSIFHRLCAEKRLIRTGTRTAFDNDDNILHKEVSRNHFREITAKRVREREGGREARETVEVTVARQRHRGDLVANRTK